MPAGGSGENVHVDADLSSIADLRRRLCGTVEGLLLVGERMDPVRVVIDPRSGQPVMPVHTDVVDREEVTLFSPDDSDDSLQILGRPVELNPARAEACDRHRLFFGRPELPRWILLEMESVKRLDLIVEGAQMTGANPLREHEGRLCTTLNERPEVLSALCRVATGTGPASPLAVGVDAFGVSVRARFGVVRLEFAREVTTAFEADAQIQGLLRTVGG